MKIHFKITIDSYNKTAEEYFQTVSSFEPLPEIEEFINLLDAKSYILDLGCGPGHHSKIFVENGFKVTGIDLSSEMVKLAKKVEPNAEFKVMDIIDLDFAPDIFDAVWASASLIHFKKKEISKALHNIRKVLKPKGLFYISMKMGTGEKETIDNRYGGIKKFHSFYDKSEIISILMKSDFDILKVLIKEPRDIYDINPWIHVFAKNG